MCCKPSELLPQLDQFLDSPPKYGINGAHFDIRRKAKEGMQASSAVTAAEAAEFEAAKTAGNAAYGSGDYSDAIAHYNRAERINPCSPLAPANRALVHLKLGDFQAANDDSTVALALQAEFSSDSRHRRDALRVKVLLRRGKARLGLGQLQNAANDYQNSLDIEAQNSDALNALRDLKERFSIVPNRAGNGNDGAVSVGDSSSSVPPVIDVISSEMNVSANGNDAAMSMNGTGDEQNHEGGTICGAHPNGHVETGDLTREFPLLQISSDAFSTLADKWTSVAPANTHEFERAWRSIRGRDVERAKYLLVIGAARIRAGLFGHSITAQLLHDFVTAFLHADRGSNGGILDILKALTSIPRFSLAVMLMSPAAKRDATALLEKIGTNTNGSNDMTALRSAFEL